MTHAKNTSITFGLLILKINHRQKPKQRNKIIYVFDRYTKRFFHFCLIKFNHMQTFQHKHIRYVYLFNVLHWFNRMNSMRSKYKKVICHTCSVVGFWEIKVELDQVSKKATNGMFSKITKHLSQPCVFLSALLFPLTEIVYLLSISLVKKP